MLGYVTEEPPHVRRARYRAWLRRGSWDGMRDLRNGTVRAQDSLRRARPSRAGSGKLPNLSRPCPERLEDFRRLSSLLFLF